MNSNIKKLFILTFLIKLALLPFIPLVLDEYYYWLWGQYPQLSYFDHPPAVGWLMSLSGNLKEFSPSLIRLPFLILSHLTIAAWYFITKDFIDQKKMFWFLVTLLLNPLIGWGAFIATPDIPLLFFWSCAIMASLNILKSQYTKDYILLGIFLGLGFLSKYVIVLFLPCLLWLVVQNKSWKYAFNPKVLWTLLFGLICSAPVFIWNIQNEWASFSFQWKHGMEAKTWDLKWPFEYLLSQIFLIFPVFLIPYFKNSKLFKKTTLLPFALFPILFFLYSSFNNRVEANWPIVAYPAIFAIAFFYSSLQFTKWFRYTIYLWAFLFIILITSINFSSHSKIRKSRIYEAEKFQPILNFSKKHPELWVHNYQMASYLTFKRNKLTCKLSRYGRPDFFNFLKPCQRLPEHFFYIVAYYEKQPIEDDYPGYKIISSLKINDDYKAFEVQKL